ncbi:MAG: guanylate kinase [Patescibacteria group bacterium]|jgi:guanylate kinase|nr:guanylate kinase [Patescibacteria group bacterium]
MNMLNHAEQFKNILKNYQMSEKSVEILNSTEFVMLSAISSSGRNTIIRELLKADDFYYIVSDTTRMKRMNDGVMEQNGVEYWFRSEEEILADLANGKYVEAAIIHNQQVSGVSIRELEKARQNKKIAISDIEVQGVHNIMQFTNIAVPIFVLPPSYDKWMERWMKRGKISDNEYDNRIKSAKQELTKALEEDYYHFLINDDLSEAVKGVRQIASGKVSTKHDQNGRKIAEDILRQLI